MTPKRTFVKKNTNVYPSISFQRCFYLNTALICGLAPCLLKKSRARSILRGCPTKDGIKRFSRAEPVLMEHLIHQLIMWEPAWSNDDRVITVIISSYITSREPGAAVLNRTDGTAALTFLLWYISRYGSTHFFMASHLFIWSDISPDMAQHISSWLAISLHDLIYLPIWLNTFLHG